MIGMIIIGLVNLPKWQFIIAIVRLCLRDYSYLILIHHFHAVNHQYVHAINLFHLNS